MLLLVLRLTAYPAVYGQFPQAIPQPMASVAASQREGKYILQLICKHIFCVWWVAYLD